LAVEWLLAESLTADSLMADSVAQWLAESSMAVSVAQWLVLASVQELAVAADLAHALAEETVLFVASSARSVDCSAALAAATVAVQLLLAVADATS
jgi:2-succinyl-5-enolpyruvyl-6-hydroxy-3-cyclohexene-1-carboxylate synthase